MKLEFPAELSGLGFQSLDRPVALDAGEFACSTTLKNASRDILAFDLIVMLSVVFLSGNIKEPCARAVRRAVPVCATAQSGIHKRPLRGRSCVRKNNRAAALVKPAGPCLFDIRVAREELSSGAIQHIVKRIPISLEHEFPRPSIDDAF